MNELLRIDLITYFSSMTEGEYWDHYDDVKNEYLKQFHSKNYDRLKNLGAFNGWFFKEFIKRDLEIIEKLFIFDNSLMEMIFIDGQTKHIIQDAATFSIFYQKTHLDFSSYSTFEYEHIEIKEEKNTRLNAFLNRFLNLLSNKKLNQ